MLNLDQFWDEEDACRPAKATDIKRAEKRIGFSLPASLVAALQIHDGGYVQDEDILLLSTNSRDPQEAINRVDKAFRDDPEALDALSEEFADPSRLVAFAATADGTTVFALNYAAAISGGEPSVVWLDFEHHSCGDSELSFDQFFEELLATEDEPSVDWSEADEMVLIAKEVTEDKHGDYFLFDQRICDSIASVVMFRRRIEYGRERLSRCEIMKPLSPDQCLIVPVPDEEGGFAYELMLAPEIEEMESAPGESLADSYETFSVLLTESIQTRSGSWKNRENRDDVPPLPFISLDRELLRRVRDALLGGREITDRARVHEQWVEKLSEMGEDQLELAFPHLMSQLLNKAETVLSDMKLDESDLGNLPNLGDTKSLLRQLIKDHRASGAATGIDPELLELTERLFDFEKDADRS